MGGGLPTSISNSLGVNGALVNMVTSTSSSYNWKYFNANFGANTVTVTATDSAGNTSTVNATVTKTS